MNIEVYPLPSTDFTYNNSDFCYPPATVQFFNNSSGASAYSWDFDNGNTSTLTNPSTTFSAGIYNITLTSSNIYNCSDNFDTTIIVYDTPIADFILSSDTICLRDSIAFNSTSLYTDSISWDFGNGDISNFDFELFYTDTGIYSVTLYAFNTAGNCIDTSDNSISIYVKNSPVADFDFLNTLSTTDPRGGRIEFFNQSQFANYYQWEFDFNYTTFEENPVYDYSYNTDGNYEFTLYSIAENGCLDSITKSIYVSFEKGLFVPNVFALLI